MLEKKTVICILGLALAISLSACTSSPTETENTPTPSVEQPEYGMPMQICLPNDNADGFTSMVTFSINPPEEVSDYLVSLLVQEGALPAGVQPNSLVDGDVLKLDMNAAFSQALNSSGTAGEQMILGALVNTMLEYYHRDYILITVEGAPLATGHNVYDEPLTFYYDQLTHYDDVFDQSDLDTTLENLSEQEALVNLFSYIGGYWNSKSGPFVGFTTVCGIAHIEYGLWDTEFGRKGTMSDAALSAPYVVDLSFYVKEIPASEASSGYPEESIVVNVNLNDYPGNQRITVTNPQLNDGQPTVYVYAGKTYQDADDAAH